MSTFKRRNGVSVCHNFESAIAEVKKGHQATRLHPDWKNEEILERHFPHFHAGYAKHGRPILTDKTHHQPISWLVKKLPDGREIH
jgi:hypothetical protein